MHGATVKILVVLIVELIDMYNNVGWLWKQRT